jgi:hypothetical protein
MSSPCGSFPIWAFVVDQVYCHGSPQITNYIASLDWPLQRAVMTGLFMCVCLTEEHHGDLRDADDNPCVRWYLDNFAGTWRVSVGWRDVKRVESQLELAERCADVVYTQAEETLSPYVTDNRLADWKDAEVCESWNLYGGVDENSSLGHGPAPLSNRSMTFWRNSTFLFTRIEQCFSTFVFSRATVMNKTFTRTTSYWKY